MSRAYPARPIVGIGVCVLKDDRVLLIRRAHPPGAGNWSLPGGAQELGETAEQTARREVAEETGLTLGPLHLIAVVDAIHRDAGNEVEYHYTIIDYAAHWAKGQALAASDAQDVAWADVTALEAYALADDAVDVIVKAREVLERSSFSEEKEAKRLLLREYWAAAVSG